MVRAVKRVLSKVAHSLIPPRFCQPWFTSCKLSSFIFWQGGILPFLSPSICSRHLWIACRNAGKKKKKGVWVGCKLSLFLWLTGAHQQQAGVAGVVKPKGELGIFCGFIILQKLKGRERGIRDRDMHWQGLFWRGLGRLRGNSENSEREFCADRN